MQRSKYGKYIFNGKRGAVLFEEMPARKAW